MQLTRLFLFLFLTVAFCSRAAASGNVVVSITPLHSLVQAVMGETGEAVLLQKGGESPHTFRLKPSDIKTLEESEVFFYIHPDLENTLADALHLVGGKVVSAADAPGLQLLAYRDNEAHDHGDRDEYGHEHEDEHKHKDEHGHEHEDEHKHKDERGHEHEYEHKHKDEHGHEHEDEHKHEDEHGHEHEDEHKHEDEHEDEHGHEHEDEHKHEDEYGHGHEYEHKHKDEHGHEHEDEHKHKDERGHEHEYEHKHKDEHGHEHEDEHKHEDEHGHEHEDEHKHEDEHEDEHGHEHEDEHKHEDEYGHGHEYEHKHEDEYGHGHEYEHKHKDEHGHEHEDEHKHKDEHGHEHEDEHKHEDEHGHEHEDEHKHEDEHGHGSENLHIWLDAANAQKIAEYIKQELSAIFPQHQAAYEANAARLIERLKALDSEIKSSLAGMQERRYIVFHDAYQYFDKRYGLSAPLVLHSRNLHALSAGRFGELRDIVKREEVFCVFYEPQFSPRTIKRLTENTGVPVAVLDPLGSNLQPGGDLYFNLLRQLTNSIKNCGGNDG